MLSATLSPRCNTQCKLLDLIEQKFSTVSMIAKPRGDKTKLELVRASLSDIAESAASLKYHRYERRPLLWTNVLVTQD